MMSDSGVGGAEIGHKMVTVALVNNKGEPFPTRNGPVQGGRPIL